jgi:uncharacterized caspase-like protein
MEKKSKKKRYLLPMVLALGLLLSLASPAPAEFYALLVGVADYPGFINDLNYTDDDAIDLGLALLEYANWDRSNGAILLNGMATKANIAQQFRTLGERMTPEDVFLFFFSGHGTNGQDIAPLDEADGLDEYLCTYDDNLRDDQLGNWLDLLPASQMIVIIDTCYSGGMIKARGDGRIKSFSGTYRQSDKGDGFGTDLLQGRNRKWTRDVDDNQGMVVLTAADDDEYSYEFDQIEHGLFTYFVIEAITEFEDLNRNNELSAEEIFQYVLQKPWFDNFGQHPQLHDGYPANQPALQELPVCIP